MNFNSLLLGKRELNSTLTTFSFLKPSTFDFEAGQFVLISFNPDYSESHPFSISSSPKDGLLEISARKLGAFTTKLHSAPLGTTFWFRGPFGMFTLDKQVKKVILIAGGVGITPFLSIIRDECSPKMKRDITLLYSAKTPEDFLEKSSLDSLVDSNKQLHITYIVSDNPPEGWNGAVGRIDKDFLMKKFKYFKDKLIFLCGPPPMVAALKEALASLGLPEQNLHIDSWEYAAKVAETFNKP